MLQEPCTRTAEHPAAIRPVPAENKLERARGQTMHVTRITLDPGEPEVHGLNPRRHEHHNALRAASSPSTTAEKKFRSNVSTVSLIWW